MVSGIKERIKSPELKRQKDPQQKPPLGRGPLVCVHPRDQSDEKVSRAKRERLTL